MVFRLQAVQNDPVVANAVQHINACRGLITADPSTAILKTFALMNQVSLERILAIMVHRNVDRTAAVLSKIAFELVLKEIESKNVDLDMASKASVLMCRILWSSPYTYLTAWSHHTETDVF